jgi:oligopeptide transport system substrate-binding protein
MAEYSKSEHTYYTTGESTFFIAINPDLDALKAEQEKVGANINKTILTVKEFRQALSFTLDRAAFCLATSPSNAPAFGAYSSLIISDPENGTAYRTTAQAKDVLVNFWGVKDEIGEGKLYATIDDAIDSITGYNLTKAKQLFDAAYDKAIAEGLMDADDKVLIMVGTPNNTSAFYNAGYEFIVNNYKEAVKGTKLEGKLEFARDDTLGNAFSDALKNNQVDMLFGVGWTGSALDPYGLMEAYVKPSYQYDDSTDFTAINCTIAIDGVEYSTSVWNWYTIMNGQSVEIKSVDGSKTITYSCGTADGDPATRLAILGALEEAVLLHYNFIPLMDDAGANLKGMQINYYTEDYIFGMGFGGVKYYTYEYSDAEWDAFVAEQGGTLVYN